MRTSTAAFCRLTACGLVCVFLVSINCTGKNHSFMFTVIKVKLQQAKLYTLSCVGFQSTPSSPSIIHFVSLSHSGAYVMVELLQTSSPPIIYLKRKIFLIVMVGFQTFFKKNGFMPLLFTTLKNHLTLNHVQILRYLCTILILTSPYHYLTET